MNKSIINAVGVAAGLVITGCAPTPTMTAVSPTPTVVRPSAVQEKAAVTGERTIVDESAYIKLAPGIVTTPTLADLEVSEKRITGVAIGPATTSRKEELERGAVAHALTQKDGADVLVGYTFYYATSLEKNRTTSSVERYLTVTVTGYPARYKNFRTYEPKNYGGLAAAADSGYGNAAVPNANTVAAPVIQPSPLTPVLPQGAAPVQLPPTGIPRE